MLSRILFIRLHLHRKHSFLTVVISSPEHKRMLSIIPLTLNSGPNLSLTLSNEQTGFLKQSDGILTGKKPKKQKNPSLFLPSLQH